MDQQMWTYLFVGVTFALYIGIAICQPMFLAPTIATAHALVGPHYRALASAFVYFVLNIIGLGLGPLTVGAISDALAPSVGIESIRWAIMSTSVAAVIGAAFYHLAARHVRQELESGF